MQIFMKSKQLVTDPFTYHSKMERLHGRSWPLVVLMVIALTVIYVYGINYQVPIADAQEIEAINPHLPILNVDPLTLQDEQPVIEPVIEVAPVVEVKVSYSSGPSGYVARPTLSEEMRLKLITLLRAWLKK